MTSYFAAVSVQSMLPSGVIRRVSTWSRLDTVPDGSSVKLDDLVDHLLDVSGLSDQNKYRVVSTFICKNVPFDEPTDCRLYATLMPGGLVDDAMYLREVTRDVTISGEYDMLAAFGDLLSHEAEYASFVGFGWSPLVLH